MLVFMFFYKECWISNYFHPLCSKLYWLYPLYWKMVSCNPSLNLTVFNQLHPLFFPKFQLVVPYIASLICENACIPWGLVSKLLQWAFSWHLWNPGTYTQVRFNLISVEVCGSTIVFTHYEQENEITWPTFSQMATEIHKQAKQSSSTGEQPPGCCESKLF